MNIYRYITLLALLLAVGCSTPNEGVGAAQGEISANISVTRSSDDGGSDDSDSEIVEGGMLRIYNAQGGLVRYYAGVANVVDYLAVGDYYATYSAGVENTASFDRELSYYGESGVVSVAPQQSTIFDIEAKVQNTVFAVDFNDESLLLHYADYSVNVYAANSMAEVTAETPTLTYDSSTDGYFILPEGVEALVWEFVGDGATITSGTVNSAKRGYKYTVSFQYTDYLKVGAIPLNIADATHSDDIFDFKVQPIIRPIDFAKDAVVDYSAQQSFNAEIKAIVPLQSISVTVGSDLYNATFTDDVASATDKVVFDTTTSTLILNDALFTTITAGSYRDVVVVATSENSASSDIAFQVGLSGFAGVSSEDFWAAKAVISWYTTNKPSKVQMRYRYKDSAAWIGTYNATSTNGHTWSAANEIVWSSAITNAEKRVVYQYVDGYRPSQNYEYQMIIDGVESDIIDVTSSPETMPVPYGDFANGSLSCYTQANGGAEFWASGNNGYTSTLCTYDSANGCPFMATTKYMGTVAAGNLYTGTFMMAGFSGTASFGQPYDWTIRPKALKFRYKVTVGSSDMGRVYMSIISWNKRHGVTSGTSAPTGVWNPVKDTKLDEGQIIAYGMVDFKNTTSAFAECEMPIYYNDKAAIPEGKYKIVISCTPSYRGDYTEGSTDSKLWVDDFKFVW